RPGPVRVTFVISDPCIGVKDESCVKVCPVDCIYDVGEMRVIAPDECIDCGACETECPVNAIVRHDEVTEESLPYVAVNAAWSDGGPAAVREVLARVRSTASRE